MRRVRALGAVSSAPPPLPGRIALQADRVRTDRDGVTLEDALARCGVEVDGIGDAASERGQCGGLPGTAYRAGAGARRDGLAAGRGAGHQRVSSGTRSRFHGQEAHSGSTPMAVRRDALAAAAKLALEIRPIARKHPDAVATMGSVKTFPGNRDGGGWPVRGDARHARSGRGACWRRCWPRRRRPAERLPPKKGCTVEWSRIWSIEPVPFDPQLIDLCDQAVRETAGHVASAALGPAARCGRGGAGGHSDGDDVRAVARGAEP